MILLIDNYDSFSYNLYQLVGKIDPDIKVVRNDEMTIDEIRTLNPSGIIISPGPGRPENAGNIIEVIKELSGEFPILGVCLGHQAICAAFGATITFAKKLMHGKQSETILDMSCPLYKECPNKIMVARYHSLAADEKTIPDCLKITALTNDGEIMGVEHKEFPVFGLQFHPESIMTPEGEVIIRNFINITHKKNQIFG